LDQLNDSLCADSQNLRDFAVTETFGAQQYSVMLLLRKTGHRSLYSAQFFFPYDQLFGIERGVCKLRQEQLISANGIREPVVCGVVEVDGEIVSDTEYPAAQVILIVFIHQVLDEFQEGIVNDVFRLISVQTETDQISEESRAETVVEVYDALSHL
jgi:hypothetical protein